MVALTQEAADKRFLGLPFTLWETDYLLALPLPPDTKLPYGATIGGGYVVIRQFRVKVVEVRVNVPSMFGAECDNWGLRALTDDGKEFTLNWEQFPDDTPTPTYYWDCLEMPANHYWQPEDGVQAYNHHIPHVFPNGERAVPAGALVCPVHDYAYYGHEHYFDGNCFKCYLAERKEERANG